MASKTQSFSRGHSCALCHQRKVRCDMRNPCSYCVARGATCIASTRTVLKPQKRRFPEAELLARLRKYENALRSYGADIDLINKGGVESKPMNLKAEAISDIPEKGNSTSCVVHGNDIAMTEKLLLASSDDGDEDVASPIFDTYDEMFVPDSRTMLLPNQLVEPGITDLSSLHPAPAQIFQLWQIYLDSIQPLLKIVHAPTIQYKLSRCVNDLSRTSYSMHALLFGMYSAVLMGMSDAACVKLLSDSRQTLFLRFNGAARHALKMIEFLRSPHTDALQATVLTFLASTKTVDPRSLLAMSAVAESIARREGFHLNSQNPRLSVFDMEMRRRIWWHITTQRIRIAETAAAGPSALCWDWDTALPLNVNETDLDPAMKNTPLEREMPTDMIFFNLRCEIADYLRQTRASIEKRAPKDDDSEFGHTFTSLAEKLKDIGVLEQRLQTQYLRFCDPHIALHAMTRYYATFALSKLKIAAYATSLRPNNPADHTSLRERQEKLKHVCLEAIEAYMECCINKDMEKFSWFLSSSVPFLAYVHLLFHLRYHPSGDFADRAWTVVTTETNEYGRRHWLRSLNPSGYQEKEDSPMQLAFANLTLRAWEAREADRGSQDPPSLVVYMRERLKLYRKRLGRAGEGEPTLAVNPLLPTWPQLTVNHPQPTLIEPIYETGSSEEALKLGSIAPLSDLDILFPTSGMLADDEFAMLEYWTAFFPKDASADD